ncbi:MAG TPA: YfhO family protein [Candidatus Eisenbacteria bacterium]|nr:YfhO family protein [Candidatus Eisenbacteria bacterium]
MKALSLRVLFFLFFAAFFAVAFHDVVFGPATFMRRDIARFYYPMWKYGVEAMRSGVFPLWNPYNNFGCPFFANVQTCVLYPPTVLLYAGPFARAFGLYVLLHLTLAGGFTSVWMRESGASAAASLAAGFAFAAGGCVLSMINLTITLCSLSWFPLILLLYRRLCREPEEGRAARLRVLAGAALLVQYLAGDPAVSFATVSVLVLFSVYRSVENRVERRAGAARPLADLGWTLAVFAGLAAFQSLLFLELLYSSIRRQMSYEECMMWSMQYNDFFAVIVPFFSDLSMYVMDYWSRQSWLENYYAGITVLCLAASGAWLERGRRGRLLVLLALAGLTLALGRNTLIYPFLHRTVPFLGFIRYPIRFFFLFAFAAACLAGHGLDALSASAGRRGGGRRTEFLAAAVVALAATVLVFSLFFDGAQQALGAWVRDRFGERVKPFYSLNDLAGFIYAALFNVRRTAIYLVAAAVGIVATLHSRPRRRVVLAYFCLLVFADLFSTNFIEPRIPAGSIEEPSGNMRAVLRDREGPFRVTASPRAVHAQTYAVMKDIDTTQENQKEQFTSNYLLFHRIQDALGYDSIYLSGTSRVQSAVMTMDTPASSRLLDWLNVKYVASPKDRVEGLERVRESPPANLFRNPRAMPRAFFSRAAVVEKDRERLLKKITAADYDPSAALYLDDGPESAGVSAAEAGGEARITRYSPNRVEMDASATAGAPWLFFSDTWYPGWKAAVDGLPVRIYRANYAFRALCLEPGRHRVVWEYDPPLFKAGIGISLLTLAFCVRAWRRSA